MSSVFFASFISPPVDITLINEVKVCTGEPLLARVGIAHTGPTLLLLGSEPWYTSLVCFK